MNGMKRKLMVFHQYLAPYRIDFFNALARRGDMEAFFEYEDSPDHHYTEGKWNPGAFSGPGT